VLGQECSETRLQPGIRLEGDERHHSRWGTAVKLFQGAFMRISRLDKSQVDSSTAEIYDVYMKERGNVPNMFRTVAHRPEILRTMIAHFRAVMNTGTVPAKLKELAIIRTSQINRCEY
jgi:alkylhydroperoxidase family enzyme